MTEFVLGRIRQFWGWVSQPQHFLIVLLACVPFFILNGFVNMHALNIPRFDQYRAIPIALAAADGTLTFGDLVSPAHGHVTFFAFLITAVNTWLTGWDLRLEAYANVVFATFNYALYLAMFWRTEHRRIAFVLVPFSMLVFSVQQDFNWIIPYDMVWHISIFWYLLAMVVLAYNPERWWALGVAALFCICATFSHGNGFIGWGAVLIYLLLSERERWRRVIVWLAVAIPTTWLFLTVAFQTVADDSSVGVGITLPIWVRLWNFVVFAVGFQGAVFSSVYSSYHYATVLGAVGLILLSANSLYLIRRERDLRTLQLWLPVMAYGMAVGLMVAFTRLEQHEPERIFLTWYTTPAMLFWVGLAAIMAVVIGRNIHSSDRWGRGLMYINLIAVVFFAGRYVVANYNDLRHPYGADQIRLQREDCYMRYIFHQNSDFDGTCIFPFYTDMLNQMAYRRLSIYDSRPPESILTDDTDPTLPILVETSNPWLNRHFEDYFLDGVDPDRIHHVYAIPPDETNALEEQPKAFVKAYLDTDPGTTAILLETVGTVDSFWYISREEHETVIPGFWEVLEERDYAQVDVVERNERIIVSRYVAVPPLLENSPRFGDDIRLRAITSVDETLAACDTLELETFWETDGEVGLPYSANLVLVDDAGNGVATSDAQLSTIPSDRWEPGAVYYDQRTLTIPCNLLPATYELYFGVYFYQTPGELLPVEDDASNRDNLAFVRAIVVTAGEAN